MDLETSDTPCEEYCDVKIFERTSDQSEALFGVEIVEQRVLPVHHAPPY